MESESSLQRTQVFKCLEEFSESREVIENLPHASCPSTSVNNNNIEKVKETVRENRRIGSREIAEDLNILYIIDRLKTFWLILRGLK